MTLFYLSFIRRNWVSCTRAASNLSPSPLAEILKSTQCAYLSPSPQRHLRMTALPLCA